MANKEKNFKGITEKLGLLPQEQAVMTTQKKRQTLYRTSQGTNI